jgi:hypothetical protein
MNSGLGVDHLCRISLRIPRDLVESAMEEAARRGVPLAVFLQHALSAEVGRRETPSTEHTGRPATDEVPSALR